MTHNVWSGRSLQTFHIHGNWSKENHNFVWVWLALLLKGKEHGAVRLRTALQWEYLCLRDRKGWRKLYSEELYDLCCSQNIIRLIRWHRSITTGHVARMRNVCKIWVTKPDGKRSWYGWKDDVNLEQNVTVWTGFIRLTAGCSDMHLLTWQWTVGAQNTLKLWADEQLWAT